jgi:hypothetical protein
MSAGMFEKDYHEGTEMAWHRLTDVKPADEFSVKTCRGAKWHGVVTPLYIKSGDGEEIKTDYNTLTASDEPSLIIGKPFASSYGLVNMPELTEQLAEAVGGVSGLQLVSHGTIFNRSQCYWSFLVDKSIVGREGYKSYVTLLNDLAAFKSVLRWGGNTERVVCANTAAIANAELKGDEGSLKIKHSKNAVFKLPDIGAWLNRYAGAASEFFALMERMGNESIKPESARNLVAGYIGDGEVLSARAANTVDRIVSLYEGGRGNEGKTVLDLYNGFTEFYTHESAGGKDPAKQWLSSEFGDARDRKMSLAPLLSNAGNRVQLLTKGERSLELTAAAKN